MKILALDSSGLVASVAVMENDTLVAEYTMNYKKTHSQTLLPMLDEIKNNIQVDLSSIDAIAAGPGSFTGLRIGSATAKGLGLALDKPLIAVPTVDALAYNLYDTGEDTVVCPIMDARRNQVYTGIYKFQNHEMAIVKEQDALSIQELLEVLNGIGKKVIFLGDGVPVFKEIIKENCKVEYSFAPAHLSRQRAGAVAALAGIYFAQGRIQTATEHQPDYLRVSQAERERAERLAKTENA